MPSSTAVSLASALALVLTVGATASCARTARPAAAASTKQPTAILPNEAVASVATSTAAPSHLLTREELRARREKQMARLQEYAKNGAFPRNFEDVNHVHMFKDPDDHFCAVANLIHMDGRDDIVDRVAFQDNGFEVATEVDTDVDAWIRTSGLTREEVSRIQAPAMGIWRAPRRTDLFAQLKMAPAPVIVAKPTEADMATALRARIATVEAELAANTEASLDRAEARQAEGAI